MSSERIYGLYKQLLGLAEDQLKALQEEKFDEAIEYLEKRQRIIDEIQNLDSEVINEQVIPLNEKDSNQWDEASRVIVINIEKILTLNNEIKATLQVEMASLLEQIGALQNFKLFFRNNNYNQEGSTISISI